MSARLLVVAALALVTAGCAAARSDDAADVARSWFAAIRAGDGQAACDLLAPEAARTVESGGEPCANALLALDLPVGSVREVQVWGEAAQVRAGEDTLFLTNLAAGWRVTAAGCAPRTGRPYDCDVEA
jgi:hypothetical protein